MPNISNAYAGHAQIPQAAEENPSRVAHHSRSSSPVDAEREDIPQPYPHMPRQRRGSGSTSQDSLIQSLRSEEMAAQVLEVMSPALRQSLRDNPQFHQITRDGAPYYHDMDEHDVISAFNTIKENIKEIAEMGASHTARLPNIKQIADHISHALDPAYMVQVGGRLAAQNLLLTTLREHATVMRTGVLNIDPEARGLHLYTIAAQAVLTAWQLRQVTSPLQNEDLSAKALTKLALRIYTVVTNAKNVKEAFSLHQRSASIDEKSKTLAKLEFLPPPNAGRGTDTPSTKASERNYIKELDYVDEVVRNMEADEANTLANRMNDEAGPKLYAEFCLGILSMLIYMYFTVEKHKSSHDASA